MVNCGFFNILRSSGQTAQSFCTSNNGSSVRTMHCLTHRNDLAQRLPPTVNKGVIIEEREARVDLLGSPEVHVITNLAPFAGGGQ